MSVFYCTRRAAWRSVERLKRGTELEHTSRESALQDLVDIHVANPNHEKILNGGGLQSGGYVVVGKNMQVRLWQAESV